MKNQIILSNRYPNIRLRNINRDDLENLRTWKNQNRRSFFFQEYITSEMQEEWYKNYLEIDNGYMFMVEEYKEAHHSHSIGCMGYRFAEEGGVDLYNIIRGEKSKINQTMASAMKILVTFLSKKDRDITCKVLKSNSALQWYLYVGFKIKKYYEDFVLLMPNEELLNTDLNLQVIKE